MITIVWLVTTIEYEDILKAMDLNFDIQKIPSMSGVDTIKVQEGNHSMES